MLAARQSVLTPCTTRIRNKIGRTVGYVFPNSIMARRARTLCLTFYFAIVVAGNGLHFLPGNGHGCSGSHHSLGAHSHGCDGHTHEHATTPDTSTADNGPSGHLLATHDCQICKWFAQAQLCEAVSEVCTSNAPRLVDSPLPISPAIQDVERITLPRAPPTLA